MKKYIAPIIIGILLILYYSFFGFTVIFLSSELSIFVRLLFLIVPLGLAGVSITVTMQRIKEIKGGEEDDASKY